MRRFMYFSGLVLVLLSNSGVAPVKAETVPAVNSADISGDVICLPGIYLTTPDSCMPVGPSTVLTQLAKDGVIYPAPSLPVSKPPVSLNEIPYKYAKITSPSAPLYGSPAQADARAPSYYLKGATRYISYSFIQDTEMGRYFQTSFGLWVDGGDLARASVQVFQGVVVHDTPKTQFGWILTNGRPRISPDFNATEVKRDLVPGEFHTILGLKTVGDTTWVMIGLGEWIEDRIIGRVVPTVITPKA